MIKHTISQLYINEAIRLRKKYFTITKNIYYKTNDLLRYSEELKKINEAILNIDEKENQIEFKLQQQQELVEDNIEKIQGLIRPEYDELQKIEEDTKILYDSLQEKYRGITTDEIKRQIKPHLITQE